MSTSSHSTRTGKRIDFTTHRTAADAEDVRHLVAHGATLEEACARVGIALETYQKREDRAAAERART